MASISLLVGGSLGGAAVGARCRLGFTAAASSSTVFIGRNRTWLGVRCLQQQRNQQQEQQEERGVDFGEVDKVLGCRLWEGKMQYLIQWMDEHPESWEPGENIAGDLVTEYMAPWWQAARKADEKMLAELLQEEESSRDVDAVDDNGRSALMFAAGMGSEACVRMLAAAGADLNWHDQGGLTALHIAAGYVHPSVVTALLQLGAEPDVEDGSGRTALKLAQGLLARIPSGNPFQFARRLALEQVVRLLEQASFEVVPVEQILDKRVAAGNSIEYLVRWADEVPDSWVAAEDVSEDLSRDYEAGVEYGVAERVLNKRVLADGGVEYLVKWADSDEDSWEPKENLASQLVLDYEEAMQQERS